MAEIRLSVTGSKKFIKAMEEAAKSTSSDSGSELDRAINVAAEHVKTKAIKNVSKGGRSGNTYKRGSVNHQASAQGEYPKTDTGELVSNITVEKIPGGYDVGSRAQAPQGYYLETKRPSEGGRPWLRRTIEENASAISSVIRSRMKKVFK